MINREHDYRREVNHYNSYQSWLNGRNPERKVLEEKYGYDVKHSMHLVRLLRMGVEILETGKVLVKRPDATELIHIRNGGWTYDQLVEYSETMNAKIEQAYKTTKLPKTVNHVRLNEEYHRMLRLWDHRPKK